MDVKAGTTGRITHVFVQDATKTDGSGLAGIAYNAAGLTAYSIRDNTASPTTISLTSMTIGTWASGGWQEVDATKAPGLYQFGIPNAAIASGKEVVFFFKGASNMVMTPKQVDLTVTDNQTASSNTITDISTAIAAIIVETAGGNLALATAISLILAAVSGKSTGSTTPTGASAPIFYAPDGTTVRISGTVDANRNRTSSTLHP